MSRNRGDSYAGLTAGQVKALADRYRELGLAACLAHAEAVLAGLGG